MNTFGDVIKTLRKFRDLTLEKCAARINSHKGYWSGIENHKVNPPSTKVVGKIAKLFSPALKDLGIEATVEDWVELAWACKSPRLIRERAMHRVRGNPLARMELRITAAKPKVVKVVRDAEPENVHAAAGTPLPPDRDLLPGEKEGG